MHRPMAHGLIARGLGRSYGDAAANADGIVLAPVAPDAGVELDPARGVVTATAGTSLGRLVRYTLPRGFTLPVLPGTAQVTLGGAIAADVHGKNHVGAGSFGRWVEGLDLVDGAGAARRLGPGEDPELFWATVGGMGLTGIVTRATIRLLPVATSRMRVVTRRVDDFDELLARMATEPGPAYRVAWVDCLAPTGYRAALEEADHAGIDDLPAAERRDPLGVRTRRVLPAPPVPISPLGPRSIRLFNALRYARTGGIQLRAADAFFHPLDAVSGWNRLYGRGGLLQYQYAVPDSAADLLRASIDRLRAAGTPPLLAVLKRMGAATPGPLSFPIAGWSLALDLSPAGGRPDRILDELDREVVAAGGRIYLAKDSRTGPETLSAMYPRIPEWRRARACLDPDGRFRSDLGRRTGLC